MILVSVFDKKASRFQAPLGYEHVSQALRSYIAFARQKPEAMQVQFAEDFDLYEVGHFNDTSGMLDATHPPMFLESMKNVVAQARKESSNV